MIEDDFYATVKLKTGEEIFAKVAASEEDDRTMLIISNPIIVSEIKGRMGVVGYKLEPWLKTTTEDMFILNLEDVLTLSESSDIEMIMMYQSYVRSGSKDSKTKIDRKMGYIANVNDAKEILEKLYKNS
jgi:Sm_like domain